MTDIELPDNVIVDTIPQQQETIVSLSNSSPVDDKKFIRRSPPIQLEWHNLEYKVKVKAPAPSNLLTAKERFKFTMSNMFKKVEKQILHPMTGYVAPGSVLAIMGPSGAGKTSLLNILSQRVKASGGEIRANGEKAGKAFRSLSAFVQQDDVLMGNLTVRESLRYAAMLRLDSKIPLKERMTRVDTIIEELGLSKAADTKVGIPGFTKGISGGERKRLCIGIELLTEPSVLFLDEPTTGLDSKTSYNVMKTISKLATHGRTVVLTIHQPSSNIYEIFDKLLLLSRGRVAYFGNAKDAVPYFSDIGHPCPVGYNPADFLMDVITENAALTGDNLEKKKRQDERIEGVLNHYSKNVQLEIPPTQQLDSNLKRFSSYNSSWFAQFTVLTMRAFINIIRDKKVTMAKFVQNIVMSLFVGLIFLQLGYEQSNVQDRIGVLFFILTNQFLGSAMSSVSMMYDEKPIFLRERGAKMYKVSSYFLARSVAEMPTMFFFPLLFGAIVYWMTNLNPNIERFFMFMFLLGVIGLTGQSLGLMIGTLMPNMGVAMAIIPLVNTVLMLFGGFYRNVNNLPNYTVWIYWTSLFHFGFEALVLNEFIGEKFVCPSTGVCAFPTGEAVIENLEMTSVMSNVWINVGLCFALALAYRIIGFLALRILVKPKGG
ncbi:abc transporter family protein [Naegleria gruberi]|uniref:Abc transporter family protein n=1 Tax=Naegleria gruberi TaxID=5762 RepID=D2V626_NAEGR|nr:abc transporter family protein [Naegleria gruberi]EFC47894.1 abc transporter family protein [Naegleria gruberi]|eukprot:XP_002680638.1 abc transporter family protein [Naegleria gruberi strain NEG-M]